MRIRVLKKSKKHEDNTLVVIETKTTKYVIRLGKPAFKLFSERNQGTNNIPIRWKYYFGERISIRTDRRLFKHGS